MSTPDSPDRRSEALAVATPTIPLKVASESDAFAKAESDAMAHSEIESLLNVVDQAIAAVEGTMDLQKKIPTGDPNIPEVSFRNFLRAAMVFRWLDFQGKNPEPGGSVDAKTTYELLARWIDRRTLAAGLHSGKKRLSDADSPLLVLCNINLQHFRLRQQSDKTFCPDVDLDEIIQTGNSKYPQMPIERLVQATLLSKGMYHKSKGSVLNMDAAQIVNCYQKSKHFLYWLEKAKNLA